MKSFVEYGDEPDISELIPQCDSYTFIKKEGIENMFPFQQKYARPCTDIMKEKLIEIIKNFAKTAGSLSGRFFEMMSYDVLRNGGCYNVPKDPTFESIDSLAPNRNGSNYIYHTTIAEKHNVGFYSF
ncbi:unnamed protein product [Rhizophagus irregularis]|uniref:Uncharacterized protein n=1 Tax=Rhizophagus irregularis TaxID=588596 RepID=A0A2N1N8K4_9GLOM|nr:hypothetical protein RhiirC2_780052 [Rhizophagus irregularis]CAB4390511.1 unnamed protein product [Rhizophagus irregularis]CAB5370738.1 unnamed protein product [Rhizophagus irregularis]